MATKFKNKSTGVIEEYLKKYNISLQQAINFSDKTKAAFREGVRK